MRIPFAVLETSPLFSAFELVSIVTREFHCFIGRSSSPVVYFAIHRYRWLYTSDSLNGTNKSLNERPSKSQKSVRRFMEIINWRKLPGGKVGWLDQMVLSGIWLTCSVVSRQLADSFVRWIHEYKYRLSVSVNRSVRASVMLINDLKHNK